MVESLLPVEIISNGLKVKTVDSIPGIHENSFLLLEDGEPFIKGACFIKIYLWRPSLSILMGKGKMLGTHGENMSCDREEKKEKEKQILYEGQESLHQKKKAEDEEVIILNTPEEEEYHHRLFSELGPLTCSRDETARNLYEKVSNMVYNKRKEIFPDVLIIEKGCYDYYII